MPHDLFILFIHVFSALLTIRLAVAAALSKLPPLPFLLPGVLNKACYYYYYCDDVDDDDDCC